MAVPEAMADLVDGRPVCVYGPDIDVLLQENRRRTAGGSMADYDAVAELACTTAQAAWDLWRQQRCERPDPGRTILFCFTAALRGGGDLGALETVRHQADDAAMAIPTASDYGINDDALAVLLKQHHTVCQRRRMPARSPPAPMTVPTGGTREYLPARTGARPCRRRHESPRKAHRCIHHQRRVSTAR
jgi:hypothetical protein